ncbi:ABC transporter substrate-binding protein [Klebsiella pneumoniae]|uniref:extracellular solute-binding protein n=1 Tax=Klebsiella pneumoniae TaxID=573 RepID=UPI0007CBC3B3|nr:extracellular solute-binding protein [Klebsiella pneumoniae]SBH67895.1 ABC transporter substrate-binding protein [Klebsiella pneumoniae]STV33775.1 ABC transporter substrate-binding protein [Klebsiella pneumoniae]HBS8157435.1 extracellular solute-binding protein [Klebsiella pneumoniae]HBU9293929.1 extracellular solute-binding protein [Klebsiella pneumoniae]
MKKAVIIMAGGLLCSSLTMAAEKADWDKVLEQAKQEGNVTFHVWYLQSQWRIFVQEFEKQYGIKVRIPEGRLDVIAMSVTQLPVMMGLKALAKIDDLPGYDDAVHQIQNVDTQGYAVAFWGNQTGFAYDPKQIGNQALPQTLDQLQSFINANPKRFGYNDPNNGGAGEAFIQRIVTITGGDFNSKTDSIDPTVVKRWQKGWLWFAANRDNITLTASGADSLTRLNDGELMLIPIWEDHLVGLQKTGAITPRLKFYVPEFGMPGGGNIAAIAANSPHPAASRLFLNWLILPSTQKAMNQAFGSTPLKKLSGPDTAVQFYGKAYSRQLRRVFVHEVMTQ